MAKAANDVENSNIQYDFLWSIHQNHKRTTTDVACLVIYGMCVVAWIGIGIHAYDHSNFSTFQLMILIKEIIWESLFFKPVIYFCAFFSILLIQLYFIVLRWCTKFVVYLTIVLEFFFITLSLIAIGFVNPAVVIPLAMFCYFIFWIEIQILRKAEVHMLCKIIVDACKVSIAFPSSLFIVFLTIHSITLLGLFIRTVIYCLYSADRVYGPGALSKIFLILSGWILTVHIACMLFVLHGTYTSLCRMTNQSNYTGNYPRLSIVIRHLFYAYRYHIGTFAYMCIPYVLMIQVIRTVRANIHMLNMKIKESPYNIYCFLVIIGSIVSNTSIVCASYGKCLYPSMKDAFKVLIQNSMIFTAARLVITGIIFFGLSLIPCITMGLVLIMNIAIWNQDTHHLLVATGLVSGTITSVVLFTFSASLDSVLFCHLEELLKNKEYADEAMKLINPV